MGIPEHKPVESGDGSRKDFGKAPWQLLPYDALEEVVRVYGIGAAKYQPRGWEAGMDWSRMYGPLQRHLKKWWQDGESIDTTDGQHHLAAVAWAALGLLAYELRGVGNDDRPKSVSS